MGVDGGVCEGWGLKLVKGCQRPSGCFQATQQQLNHLQQMQENVQGM